MTRRLRHAPRARALIECFVTCLCVAAFAFLATLLTSDSFPVTWDTLNHHIYLGSVAQTARWHLDVIPAGSQTYQYPYTYWPLYRFSLIEAPGGLLSAVWVGSLVLIAAPAVWLIIYNLVPDRRSIVLSIALRVVAMYLAFCSLGVVFAVQTTSNDFVASIPILWGLALAVVTQSTGNSRYLGTFLIGVGIAFKLSNVVFLCFLPFAALPAYSLRQLASRLAVVCCATVGGFAVAYAPWGWHLYRETTNPFHPHFQSLFSGH